MVRVYNTTQLNVSHACRPSCRPPHIFTPCQCARHAQCQFQAAFHLHKTRVCPRMHGEDGIPCTPARLHPGIGPKLKLPDGPSAKLECFITGRCVTGRFVTGQSCSGTAAMPWCLGWPCSLNLLAIIPFDGPARLPDKGAYILHSARLCVVCMRTAAGRHGPKASQRCPALQGMHEAAQPCSLA